MYFNTVVLSFLPAYLNLLATNAEGADHKVAVFGVRISGSSFFSFFVPVSVIGQLIFFLLFGAVGDYGALRRPALAGCMLVGALATCAFALVTEPTFVWGGVLLVLSNVAMGLSVIYYNAYLPLLVEAAPEVRAVAGTPAYDDKSAAVSGHLSNVG